MVSGLYPKAMAEHGVRNNILGLLIRLSPHLKHWSRSYRKVAYSTGYSDVCSEIMNVIAGFKKPVLIMRSIDKPK